MLTQASTTSLTCAQSSNPSLMRELIETQVVDQKRTASTGMNNLRAVRRETSLTFRCCTPPGPLT